MMLGVMMGWGEGIELSFGGNNSRGQQAGHVAGRSRIVGSCKGRLPRFARNDDWKRTDKVVLHITLNKHIILLVRARGSEIL